MHKKVAIILTFLTIFFIGLLAYRYYEIQQFEKQKKALLETQVSTSTPLNVAPPLGASSTPDVVTYETSFGHKTDIFKDISIGSGDTLKSGTKITGFARGNWYFEGIFPVTLVTGTSTVLWQGGAKASSDWMTTDYVPFSFTVSYTPIGTPTPATLILKKDNPSGDPANDDQLEIPVMVQ